MPPGQHLDHDDGDHRWSHAAVREDMERRNRTGGLGLARQIAKATAPVTTSRYALSPSEEAAPKG